MKICLRLEKIIYIYYHLQSCGWWRTHAHIHTCMCMHVLCFSRKLSRTYVEAYLYSPSLIKVEQKRWGSCYSWSVPQPTVRQPFNGCSSSTISWEEQHITYNRWECLLKCVALLQSLVLAIWRVPGVNVDNSLLCNLSVIMYQTSVSDYSTWSYYCCTFINYGTDFLYLFFYKFILCHRLNESLLWSLWILTVEKRLYRHLIVTHKLIIIRNMSWAWNQRIKMISEGSCDTEDWSNSFWKFSFAITGINYILKQKIISK